MNVYKKIVRLSLPVIVLSVLIFLAVFFLFLYLFGELSAKWATIVSGLSAGLVVAIIQFLIGWDDYVKTENVRRLGIKDVLPTRDDFTYYGRLISKAKKRIYVLGTTASRFLGDFADDESPRSDKKVLNNALARGVDVRILLPHKEFLPETSRETFEVVGKRMKELIIQFPNNFEFRYFRSQPSHSMVVVDDDALIGPKFPSVASKDSPVIHVNADSPYAEVYLRHFNDEWDRSGG